MGNLAAAMPAHESLSHAAFAARSDGPAFLLDATGKVVEVNAGALRLLACTRDEVQGRPAHAFLSPDLEGALAEARERGVAERETLLTGKSAPSLATRVRITALRDRSNLLGYGVEESVLRDAAMHERLQIALTASRMGIWEWDLPSGRIHWSPECLDILGVASFEGTLAAFEALVHPDDVSVNRVKVAQAVERGEDYASEFRIRTPSGTEIWVSNLARPIRGPEGRVTRLVGTVQDITHRKRAEWSARESEERLRIAIQAAPMSTWSLDPESRVVEVIARSGSWVAGMPVDRFTLDEVLQAVHPDDRAQNAEAFDRTIATGAPLAVTCRLLNQDGPVHWTVSRGSVILGPDGKQRVFGVTLDITERIRADAALASAEERFARVFQALPVGLCIAERDGGRCVDANPAFLELLGKERHEVIDHSVLELGLWESPTLREAFASCAQASLPDTECTIRTGKGETRHVVHSVEAIDMGGRPCVLSIAHDVTARKRSEQTLLQAGKMEAVGRLAGGLAHDFNNLLSVLSATCFLLPQEVALGRSIDELVEVLREVSERGSGLTRQLLAVSRQQVAQPANLDCHEHLRRNTRLLRHLLGEDIEVVTEFAAGTPTIRIDPSHFEQVLLNLAANARDAMPQGGRMTIRTESVELLAKDPRTSPELPPGSFVAITISDTGSGMSPEARERAFEPFFTTKPVGKGTGLGLSVVQGIVRQAGGTITILSQEGLGTSVTILLPRVATRVDSQPTREARATRGGTETLLVVEDDAGVRSLVCASLRSLGYTVVEASDGQQAIERFAGESGRIRLVLTDVIMPRMSGRQLAEELRKENPDLEIVYMSGYPDDQLLRRGVLDGRETYLQKPFSMLEMSELVRRLLEK